VTDIAAHPVQAQCRSGALQMSTVSPNDARPGIKTVPPITADGHHTLRVMISL